MFVMLVQFTPCRQRVGAAWEGYLVSARQAVPRRSGSAVGVSGCDMPTLRGGTNSPYRRICRTVATYNIAACRAHTSLHSGMSTHATRAGAPRCVPALRGRAKVVFTFTFTLS